MISSHDVKEEGEEYGSGSKLMEHSYKENGFVGAVVELLKKEWKGDKIAWIGDYHESGEVGDVPTWEEAEDQGYTTLAPPAKTNTEGFLNNETLGLSIDMTKLTFTERGEEDEGWELHPLSLLTACGNGRGGGDYRGEDKMGNEIIGMWAGHEFSFTPNAVYQTIQFDNDMNDNALRFIKQDA